MQRSTSSQSALIDAERDQIEPPRSIHSTPESVHSCHSCHSCDRPITPQRELSKSLNTTVVHSIGCLGDGRFATVVVSFLSLALTFCWIALPFFRLGPSEDIKFWVKCVKGYYFLALALFIFGITAIARNNPKCIFVYLIFYCAHAALTTSVSLFSMYLDIYFLKNVPPNSPGYTNLSKRATLFIIGLHFTSIIYQVCSTFVVVYFLRRFRVKYQQWKDRTLAVESLDPEFQQWADRYNIPEPRSPQEHRAALDLLPK